MPDIRLQDIRSAHQLIKDKVHQTPVQSSQSLSDRLGAKLFFKCENFQKTGSFKVRGVLNKIHHLNKEARTRGVVTISAGNHAQAVAWAATDSGIKSTVVMPAKATKTKVAASDDYGAEVILQGDVIEAFEKALQIEKEEGKTLIHPFEDHYIIAGHGTVGLEILEQVEDLDVVVVGIGGGALCTGIAAAIKQQHPQVKIYGVEPTGADSMRKSMDAGKAMRIDQVNTIADGLGSPMAGELTYALVRKYVDDVIIVTDDEIAQAMYDILTRTKLVIEPAGAAATAALLTGKIPITKGQKIVSVLSGGNVDVDKISELTKNCN